MFAQAEKVTARLGHCCWDTPPASGAARKTHFVFEAGEDRSKELVCQGRNSSDLFKPVPKLPMPLAEALNL